MLGVIPECKVYKADQYNSLVGTTVFSDLCRRSPALMVNFCQGLIASGSFLGSYQFEELGAQEMWSLHLLFKLSVNILSAFSIAEDELSQHSLLQ